MFCDFGVKTCNKFLSNPEYRQLDSKQERIRYALRRFDLNRLLQTSGKIILEHSRKNSKCSELAEHHLKCAETLFACTNNVKEQLEKAMKNASKSLLNADYGGETFVKALQLRCKCFIKMDQFEQALNDVEMAILYGGFHPERALLKGVCLHSKTRFKPLKDYLRSINVEGFDDKPVLEELNMMHLSFSYLYSFIDDPNFAHKTTKPTDAWNNPPVLHYIESLTSYRAIYELDSRCKIQNDDYKGRHFMANGFIPLGTTVLVERTYSLVLDGQSQLERCLYCHKTCPGFVPCKLCVEAIFCSESCSQHAWDLFHKHECKLISLFKDTYNVSLHMYRCIALIGVKQALAIDDKMQNQQSQYMSQLKEKMGETSPEQARNLINDDIIVDYMEDEDLRTTATFRQSKSQLQKMYLMNQALLDHNDMFEDYYDTCYMGVSLDVALMLSFQQFLAGEGDHLDGLLWDQLETKRFERLDANTSDSPFLGSTLGKFMQLVAIVQLNIRKLVTNVFSWNIYDETYQVKKSVGTCQCLVGSLINHSCSPNVEWDFKNGCIVYTSLRDIADGEEINNSYGPHRSTAFIERQNLLSGNYYFNCRCSLCKKEVVHHPYVLSCQQCRGPVVCLPEIVVNANCMNCTAEYADVQYRMKRVNQSRVKFKSLMHFFADQPYGGNITDELASRFSELIETMDYQVTYCYEKSVQFQINLQAFCRLLARLGKQDQACSYGQHQALDELYFKSSNKMKTALAKLENSIFWFQLYSNYLSQCGKTSGKENVLLPIARGLMENHYGTIQQAAVQLDTQEANDGKEENAMDELTIQDLLDAAGESEHEQISQPSSVPSMKQLLSNILQLSSTQYDSSYVEQ